MNGLTQLFAGICYPSAFTRRKVRIILEVDINDLCTVDDSEDFPTVWYDGQKVEVEESSMQAVQDEHDRRAQR